MPIKTLAHLHDVHRFTNALRHPTHVVTNGDSHTLRLIASAGQASVDWHLADTPIWGYSVQYPENDAVPLPAAEYPGPTIELPRGFRLRIKHWNLVKENGLPAKLPFRAVTANEADEAPNPPTNSVGWDGDGEAVKDFEGIQPWLVTHLHGGLVGPDSDGWTENVSSVGQIVETVYQPPVETYSVPGTTFSGGKAPTLWYHDHAMGVTRFNVYAGLAGALLLRDPIEQQLHLPTDREHEWVLLLQDRNMETDDGTDTGELTGKFLHKVSSVMEFFGPLTLVNGSLWPFAAVKPTRYRLRIINGANARTFCLNFCKADKTTVHQHIRQIGSDGGLLPKPVELPAQGLTLAPGERADLLVDFGPLGNQAITVYNTATAPYGGSAGNVLPGEANIPGRLRFPEVMQFKVEGASVAATAWPTVLDKDFRRLVHANPGVGEVQIPEPHQHRWVALTEESPDKDGPATLFLRELEELDSPEITRAPHDGIIEITGLKPSKTQFLTMAKGFTDKVNFIVEQDGWEVWKIINLTGDTHPFHIHLVQFQVMSRTTLETANDTDGDYWVNADEKNDYFGSTVPENPLKVLTAAEVDENEKGWKDTVRVNPGEMLVLAAQFKTFAGRYMYHCHILEHEDHEMMRPFVVAPAGMHPFMTHTAGGHAHGHMG